MQKRKKFPILYNFPSNERHYTYFQKYTFILIIAKMKSLGFSFIDTFSYSKKRKKKKTTTVVTRLFSTDRCPSLAALADVARSNQFLPPLRNPFKRCTTKVIKSSHYGAWIGINGRADVYPLPCTNFPRRVPPPFAPTSTLIRIHGYHFMPDLMSRIN